MASPTITISSDGHFRNILSTSRIVVADFWAEWCGPCHQIAPVFQTLSEVWSRPDLVSFVKINNDDHQGIAQRYNISALPTFLVFRDGEVIDKVQGANPTGLSGVLEKLAKEIASLNGGGESSGTWRGAEVPRGYGDITDQVELKGCELLNADEDAGPVRVLFEGLKPSALGESKDAKDWVQSGSDDQLLLFLPFQSTLKLHTLQITSIPPTDQTDVSRPSKINLFINRPQNMSFDEAEETEPTQAIELGPSDWNPDGTASIPLRFVKFQKTTTLIIFVEAGDGEAESVRIDRVRLIGEAGVKREMGKLQKVGDDEE